MSRMFGTDGVRGVANEELTPLLAMQLGQAGAYILTRENKHKPTIMVGCDTRISGDMLANALMAGICSVGANAVYVGVIPTPAIAYLTQKYKVEAGVVISASHNPCEYNGIKIFNGEGYKLSDSLEEEIEAIVLDGTRIPPCPTGGEIGRVTHCKSAVDDYVRHLLSTTNVDLRGMRLAVDCANGSASATARKLFSSLGADCVFLNDQPDGVNINENCGSTHIDQLAEFVKKLKYFAGVAFDGDADRCLAVDENGNLLDGDKIIAALAVRLKEQGNLPGNTAVATVMSNLGFFRFCEQHGIDVVSTKVGDRYVLEEMVENGYAIGGEQSGHIIFLQYATTGDGQMSAIQLLSMCREQGVKLSRIGEMMERYPQVLINVKADAGQKARFGEDTALAAEVEKANASLGRDGRVLVRVSGTEPLIRIMVEGKDFDDINRLAVELGETIKARIGAED